MSTEEKARAYDEALERAKKLSVDGYLDAIAVEEIFPQLRESESEDERIRKALVWHLKAGEDFVSNGVTKAECIAYLEKQKYDRMKPIYDAKESFESALERAWKDYHNGYENVDKLEDDYVERAHAKGFREGYLFGIEKQKEQKPNYCHYGGDPSVERCKYCSASCSGRLVEERYSPLCNTIKDKIHEYIANHFIADTVVKTDMRSIVKAMEEGVRLGKEERKPAEWSEEDEKMLDEIIRDVMTLHNARNPEELKAKIDFIKSLRSYPIQLKEAYKDGFQTVRHATALTFMNHLDENRPDGKMGLSNVECEDIDKAFKENDWAKIIRYIEKYSPSWKPSEEQMRCFDMVLCDEAMDENVHRVLVQLREQLKRLM